MGDQHMLRRWGWVPIAASLTACSYPRPNQAAKAPFSQTLKIDTADLYRYAAGATVYSIGAFDKIIVTVYQYPDLSGEFLVKEDGTVFVPNAGNVPIAGFTLREAQNELTRALEPFVPRAQVDVKPSEIRSKVYYLSGEIKNPGAYPVLRPVTLGKAVALAGGLTATAFPDSAYLSRRGKAYPIDLQRTLSTADDRIYLQGGDMVYVPSSANATVYVLGEVVKPSAVALTNGGGLGVIQAISAAGGLTGGADEDEVAIIRRVGDNLELRVVNVENALKSGAGEALAFRLHPGDIVWVPPMGIANWNRALALISPTLDTLLFKPLSGARDYFLIKDILDRGNP